MAPTSKNRIRPSAKSWARRIARAIGYFLALLLVWAAITAARILWLADHDTQRKADVIIVLGAAVRKGQPSPAFAGRIQHGIELRAQGRAPKLLFTGGLGHGDAVPEAEIAKTVARHAGVPAADILTETVSTVTWENITEARRLMQEHGLHSAIIVSDPYHLYRAQLMADDAGIVATTSPKPHTAFRTWRTKIPFLFSEVRLALMHQIAQAVGFRQKNFRRKFGRRALSSGLRAQPCRWVKE